MRRCQRWCPVQHWPCDFESFLIPEICFADLPLAIAWAKPSHIKAGGVSRNWLISVTASSTFPCTMHWTQFRFAFVNSGSPTNSLRRDWIRSSCDMSTIRRLESVQRKIISFELCVFLKKNNGEKIKEAMSAPEIVRLGSKMINYSWIKCIHPDSAVQGVN